MSNGPMMDDFEPSLTALVEPAEGLIRRPRSCLVVLTALGRERLRCRTSR